MYMKLDNHKDLWSSLLLVCSHYVTKKAGSVTGKEDGVHHSVGDDIKKLFKTKTYKELETLQSQIQVTCPWDINRYV